jgi:ornithine carbamoyltransferase
VLAYIGDANNMARSLVKAALMEGMDVRVASPAGYAFSAEEHGRLTALARRAGRGGTLRLTHDPEVAAGGADALYTDVWTSMGQEAEADERTEAFSGWTLNEEMLRSAKPGAVVLHCLPAHRGEEIDAATLEGPRSRVWDQAENRLHVQKALLVFLIRGGTIPSAAP